jgi:predicted DNA-binding protein
MTTISLKLPEPLLARLEKESRARRTTKSSLVREATAREDLGFEGFAQAAAG